MKKNILWNSKNKRRMDKNILWKDKSKRKI